MKITAIVLATVLAWIPMGAHARFASAPLPYSCEQVRWATSKFSIEHLKAMGKALGISLTGAQMRQAQKCIDATK